MVSAHYRPQAEDTSIATDVMVFQLLRQRSCSDRIQMARSLTQNARRLSLSGLHSRFPDLSAPEFARKVANAWLQSHCPSDYLPLSPEMNWIQDSIGLAAELHPLLEALHIPYYITGGVAAIAYGEPRTTQDLDMVLEVAREDIPALAMALEAQGFYVPGVEDVQAGRLTILGIIQVATISRADLMLSGSEDFDRLKFQRRRLLEIPSLDSLYFASPEDVILSKLQWRQTSQSEKQWRDILGLLKVQGDTLEWDYLRDWATRLNVRQDLEQAIAQAS